MNPTEWFIEELHKLLREYEEKTGNYVKEISIGRHTFCNINASLRNKSIIDEIKLQME